MGSTVNSLDPLGLPKEKEMIKSITLTLMLLAGYCATIGRSLRDHEGARSYSILPLYDYDIGVEPVQDDRFNWIYCYLPDSDESNCLPLEWDIALESRALPELLKGVLLVLSLEIQPSTRGFQSSLPHSSLFSERFSFLFLVRHRKSIA